MPAPTGSSPSKNVAGEHFTGKHSSPTSANLRNDRASWPQPTTSKFKLPALYFNASSANSFHHIHRHDIKATDKPLTVPEGCDFRKKAERGESRPAKEPTFGKTLINLVFLSFNRNFVPKYQY